MDITGIYNTETRKYGTVMITNNSKSQRGYPAGLVIRWMQTNGVPGVMIVKNVFLSDFTCISEIRDYIDENSILG